MGLGRLHFRRRGIEVAGDFRVEDTHGVMVAPLPSDSLLPLAPRRRAGPPPWRLSVRLCPLIIAP